jgi:hypothetical protein
MVRCCKLVTLLGKNKYVITASNDSENETVIPTMQNDVAKFIQVYLKGTVQRKLTGLSYINQKLMISSIGAGYIFFNLKGHVPLNLK